MPKEEKCSTANVKIVNKGVKNHATGGGIYGLAFLGAFIYYLVTATTFWMGAWGFVKALLWPAFLIYQLYQYLGM